MNEPTFKFRILIEMKLCCFCLFILFSALSARAKKFNTVNSLELQTRNNTMSRVKLNLIAAACDNMGIGVNGTLPWRLKKEMAYFSTMTTTVSNLSKVNAVIMGRVTWDCIPLKYRPLDNRVNVVLTRNTEKLKGNVPEGVIVLESMDEAVKYIEGRSDIESTWVIGGSAIYKAAMEHPNCDKIYLTEIQKSFECDTFFPALDTNKFQLTTEDRVPHELQTEGDISYYFRIYQKL